MLRLVMVLFLFSSFLFCEETSKGRFAENNESRRDVLYTNLAGAAVITAWGIVNWDYGKNKPHAGNEGWFNHDTKSGGADKLGHFYSAYLVGSTLSGLYASWGYEKREAALYGSLSSFLVMNYMELGDAFSSYGFSYEDFVMNCLGAASAYLLYAHPELSGKVDFRLEYVPSFKTVDVVTEYEKMKYLITLKAEGFESISHPWLRYSELHLGYYTRNYKGGFSSQSERIIYLGVGINLSRLFRQNGYEKTARFFNYYQLPYTYLPYEHDFSR
ncbi:MAG: DUF2279 domain-containing protein [Campylobacterales bacterium]|nr:DUF2279 domain-containing protein [Campylobacterales bacterium]